MAKADKSINIGEETEIFSPLFDDGLYTEVVHESGERAIKILKGKYKDIIYQYGKVELVPMGESKIPTINFGRAVRSCPEEMKESISTDKIFNQVMGDILMELLSIQGLEEYNRGIQQRVQAETD